MYNIKKITGKYLNNNNQTYDVQKKRNSRYSESYLLLEQTIKTFNKKVLQIKKVTVPLHTYVINLMIFI